MAQHKPATRKKSRAAAPKAAAAKSAKTQMIAGPTKTQMIVGLLMQPGGSTVAQIMKKTGWQAHSVRGFISGTVGKKMGLGVTSLKNVDGHRIYSVDARAAGNEAAIASLKVFTAAFRKHFGGGAA